MRTEVYKNGVLVEVIEKPDDKARMIRAERQTLNRMALDGEILITEVEQEFARRKAMIEAMPEVPEKHLVRDETGQMVEKRE